MTINSVLLIKRVMRSNDQWSGTQYTIAKTFSLRLRTWRSVSSKLLASLWYHGPSVLRVKQPKRLRRVRSYAHGPWIHFVATLSQYKARLAQQSHGILVPRINGVPMILSAEEMDFEEDNLFVRWVHTSRQIINMMSLRESASVANVRLERKHRYNLSSLKARGQLRSTFWSQKNLPKFSNKVLWWIT